MRITRQPAATAQAAHPAGRFRIFSCVLACLPLICAAAWADRRRSLSTSLKSLGFLPVILILQMPLIANATTPPPLWTTSITGAAAYPDAGAACVAAFAANYTQYTCPVNGGYCWSNSGPNPALSHCTASCGGNCGSLAFCVSAASNCGYGASLNGTCPSGYRFDSITKSCVAQCPDHAHGPPCACDDGYKFDAAGTSCVPEQYTIALQIPSPAEVMPGASKSAYAKVTKSDGSAKSGAQVNLALTVVPEEDGYNHAVGQHTAPHEGTLLPTAGTTGSDGRLNFTFTAREAGGTHTITATCIAPNCTNQATGTIKVPGCPVSDLTNVEKLSNIWDATAEQKQLTQQLENDIDGYDLLSEATKAGERCLADRINTVVGPPSVSEYQVTSTIRTPAYQKHFVEVWEKFWDLKGKIDKDPTLQQRCQTLITRVEGEMGFRLTQNPSPAADPKQDCNPALGRAHCIRFPPAKFDPKHVAKTAFDIPLSTVSAFQAKLLRLPTRSTVAKEANACNLKWGGLFDDRIHFACCVK